MSIYTPTAIALDWHCVGMADKERYLAIAEQTDCRGADRFFANLYIWNETYHQEIAFLGDTAFIRFGNGEKHKYLPPVSKDLTNAMKILLQHDPLASFVAVTEAEAAHITDVFADAFVCTEVRAHADYIYEAESLSTLAGKKLHAKRNHINAFTAANEWAVHPLTAADHDSCRLIAREWAATQEGKSVEQEQCALERALHAFAQLELHGAILTVNGRAVAFTIGSIMGDTMDVHFEKTLPDITGAYPVINREFVRMMREIYPALRFVNREEDMGLENLRRAKLSYRPALLLQKFTLKSAIGQF